MAVRNEYTDTVRDLQALIKKENDAARRESLGENLLKMSHDLEEQRKQIVSHAVLAERLSGLTKIVWGLLVVIVLEFSWLAVKGPHGNG